MPADVVVPVPDSGVPAALGYAQAAGLPFEMGIIRNHYVGRTFIQPTQGARELGVRMKLSPNRSVLAGKRVMLIDNSIVRGTNSVRVVRMVREAGAKEVHLRSASPPIRFPDFYGIDMPDRDQPAGRPAYRWRRWPSSWRSTAWRSSRVDGLYWAMGAGPRDPERPAVHRPLFHRRLSDPAARSRDRRGPQRARRAPALIPGRRVNPLALMRRLRIDPYILAILSMVLLASLLPARGQVSVGFDWLTKVVIALLFFLHGARLSRGRWSPA